MNGTYRTASRLSALLGLSLAVWAPAGQAQVAPPLTTLVSFNGRDGINPISALIQAKDGNLYGTTADGGANGSGTVFKITTSGALTTLYSFSNNSAFTNSDGANPEAALIQGKDGDLYGTCYQGGVNGWGTVFKITTSGALTILYSFSGYPIDGGFPAAGLVQGRDGNLYGACSAGGANGWGTVFKITTSGALTTLYTFSAPSSTSTNADGADPQAGLIQGKDGDLYGTCEEGGTSALGTVFKITTSGAFTTLHSFSDAEGIAPLAGLVQGKDGDLYGTTQFGGNGSGTVFKITTSGVLTVLYTFGFTDGRSPYAALIQGRDGNLYGTTHTGGASGSGTVFKITTSGALTTLHSFSTADGAAPTASPIQGKDGDLYGTCTAGGANGNGTVFKLTMTPVITGFSPIGGPVGATVTVTGANFTEATTVKFGSTSVSFKINSDTSLTFAVPAPGAASDKITIINPYGTGVSAKPFMMSPVITGFSPGSGKVGTSVTLTGAAFTGTTAVKLGTVAAAFAVTSDTSLTLTVPTGAVTAKITVVNTFGTGTSTKSFVVKP
jgi:uncharacterized repeat protein (TIGR03803 family)